MLRLEPETRVLVTEMGMRGAGQIAELCAVAQPHVVVVTSIGPEHLELVGTVDDVARTNAEAIEALPAGGVAVLPADAPELEPYLGRVPVEIRRFDRSTVDRLDDGRWRFWVGGRALDLELPFDRRHLAENVLAALTAYDALGLPLERAAGRRRADRAVPLARRDAPAARRRLRRQRRVQREPHLDARRARGSHGASATAAGGSPCWARWPSSAPRATAITQRSAS